MQICVIGTGYVGLVAGACFADTGNTVYCVDIDQTKISNLKKGIIPIFEPTLDELVKKSVTEERLFFTTDYQEAVVKSEIIFLAVGTPPLPSGDPDLSYLKSASESVARAMNGFKVIVNKSTVPIGAHKTVSSWIKPLTQHPFEVVSNPEFLKEGSAIDDFLKPDRVVIGTKSDEAFKKMAQLYAPFVRQGNPIICMDPISAEMTKYACNAFLATRISFMNELSILCEKLGGDIEDVRKGMATDVRIGKHFLYAGVGYGGSCFPKDIQALMSTAKKNDIPMGIVTAAEDANARQKKHLVKVILKFYKDDIRGKIFGIWGLAFKPNTDDMREAASLTIIKGLLDAGAHVKAFDPISIENTKHLLPSTVVYTANPYEAIDGADALVVVTEWNEFRHPDFERIKKLLKAPVIFDGRNVFEPSELQEKGFKYYGLGRAAGSNLS